MLSLPRMQERRGICSYSLSFEEVAKIEKEHEERYLKLLENVEGGLVFSRDEEKNLEMLKLRSYRYRERSTGGLPGLFSSSCLF